MNKLIGELQRLYFLDEQHCYRRHAGADATSATPADIAAEALSADILARTLAGEMVPALALLSAAGTVRTMVLRFGRSADWPQVARVYRAVRSELVLPAPALAVAGDAGFGLWFSLAQPVPWAQAQAFLHGLGSRYLAAAAGEAAPADACPASAADRTDLVPALQPATGLWSAFIDPTMGSMFIDEPGLEMAPSMDKQAEMLAGLVSIKPADFQRALAVLQAPATADLAVEPGTPVRSAEGGRETSQVLTVGGHFSDPQSFLLAVMNDSTASPQLRVDAAKALLPYCK